MALSLNHLNIVVSDLERSLEFYSRFFGCREWLREGAGFAILRCGDFDLALTQGKALFARALTLANSRGRLFGSTTYGSSSFRYVPAEPTPL